MKIDYIISRIKKEEDIPLLIKAYNFAWEKSLCFQNGDTIISHILEVTNTLIDFNADNLTLVSSILYETINYGVRKEVIEKEFGSSVALIIDGIVKINKFELNNDKENSLKCLNELRDDSPEDVRILFIKLADRLYNMKMMENLPVEEQKRIAKETLYTLVPTASRIRLNYIKSKLEDLCLYYLDHEAYNGILKKLQDSPDTLKIYLNKMKDEIAKLLADNLIEFKIKARVKSIYSIYDKLNCGKNWEEIYDILAIRILVNNEDECRLVANLIHSKYRLVPARFKDYISFPKENMYQGLHTTIIGDDGRTYEIQIKTHEMNKTAEEGKAAHHLYKKRKLRNNCL